MSAMANGVGDDLAMLTDLTEVILMDEIRARFQRGIIYTYIGDILLAVNPNRNTDLYGPEMLKKYSHLALRSSLPPHIFAVSDCALHRLCQTSHSQCCVVSGESGAGKTETTKLIVEHIVHLCQEIDTNDLHHNIVEVNPLLEAFGNARTNLNSNSSRFGKYIELQFDKASRIQGAVIFEYLLEKSRVVQQSTGESNFHIFYYLFAGLDSEKLRLHRLEQPENHRIVRPFDGSRVFETQDIEKRYRRKWIEIMDIFTSIGFIEAEKDSIIEMLIAVLHITDLKFVDDQDVDGVYIGNDSSLAAASSLLGIQSNVLGSVLCANKVMVRGEAIVALKNVYQAEDGRDALAKALYGRLFTWIVLQINTAIQKKCKIRPTTSPRTSDTISTIGILDIYGFENSHHNSFEQLCINVANEHLQLYFNQHIFQCEFEEYSREGIKASVLKFNDNQPLINLFMAPSGFYALLDEESKFPKATDLSLVEKLTKEFSKKAEFERPRGQNLLFVIHHYAGPVSYSVYGFLDKNRDNLSGNIAECLETSSKQFVRRLFSLNAPNSSMKSTMGHGIRPLGCNYNSKTLASYFKFSLVELLSRIQNAQPHFVRCIQPNTVKSAQAFDSELVLKQLRYTGVMATVQIRRQGFSVRLPFRSFIDRYKFIVFPLMSKVECNRRTCNQILQAAGIQNSEIGKTKVFLKYYHTEQLDCSLLKPVNQVVRCQKYFRGHQARTLYTLYKKLRDDAAEAASLIVKQNIQPVKPNVSLLRIPHNDDAPTRVPPPRQSGITMGPILEELLEEAMSKLADLVHGIWGKVHYLYSGELVCKFYLREDEITINSSNADYGKNGKVFGLSGYNRLDLNKLVGKGVKIFRDEPGNLYACKLADVDIIVRGYREPQNNCLSQEIITSFGHIGPTPVMIFDISKFKMHLALELRKSAMNIRRIELLSMITFSFLGSSINGQTNGGGLDNTCYINIINFAALDLLGDIGVLPELLVLAQLSLSREDAFNLQDTWMSTRRRKIKSRLNNKH